MVPQRALVLVRLIHTLVWAFFVACILGVPLAALAGHLGWAVVFSVIVLLEWVVLVINRFRCPLTEVVARFTDDRADNFDIFLPVWLAKHNKEVFWSTCPARSRVRG